MRLEPHKDFKRALIGAKEPYTYSYWRLVDVVKEMSDLTDDDAVEYVEYNIMGLVPMGLRVKYSEEEKGR